MKHSSACLFFLSGWLAACGAAGTGTQQQIATYDPSSVPGTQVGVVTDDGSSPEPFFLDLYEDHPSAKDALDATALQIVYLDYAFGAFVCKINATGTSGTVSDPCPSPDGKFWAFFYKRFGDEDWTFSTDRGVSAYFPEDGDMVAMVWTDYDPSAQAPARFPPDLTLVDLISTVR